jgi:hypothetical protein
MTELAKRMRKTNRGLKLKMGVMDFDGFESKSVDGERRRKLPEGREALPFDS